MVSDASEPAEGEHKVSAELGCATGTRFLRLACGIVATVLPCLQIMRFIRAARADPAYDPHTCHCVYGQVSSWEQRYRLAHSCPK